MRVLLGYSRSPVLVAMLRDRGIDAFTCDLREAEHPWHLSGNIWETALEQSWDLAIFHPVCTYLTCSGAWAFKEGPYHQKVSPATLTGARRVAAREESLADFRRLLALPIPHIAIENPAPSFVSKAIRPPDQTIQPYEFGEDKSKRTGWWLKWLPKLTPTYRLPGRVVEWPKGSGKKVERWANQSDNGAPKAGPSASRWAERSLIGPGVYRAMAEQWIYPLLERN